MKKRKTYETPSLMKSYSVQLETDFLGGSVVDPFNAGGVTTSGQEVQEMDFSNETSFSHEWE